MSTEWGEGCGGVRSREGLLCPTSCAMRLLSEDSGSLGIKAAQGS